MSHSSYIPSKDLTTTIIRCPFSKCHARIIKPTSSQSSHDIKISQQFLKIDESSDSSNDGVFLRIEDAWDFDNIGVSKEIPEKKEEDEIERLIVCADCERGPLGFAKFDNDDANRDVKNLKFYLHLNSCLYQDV